MAMLSDRTSSRSSRRQYHGTEIMKVVAGDNDKVATRTSSSIAGQGSTNNNGQTILRSRRHSNMLSLTPSSSSLFILLQLVLLIGMISGQSTTTTTEDTDCVCSPRQFYFKLNLSASCPALPPPFPPNDVFGSGVKDYTCSIGPEPVQNDAGELMLDGEEDDELLEEPSSSSGAEDDSDGDSDTNAADTNSNDSIAAALASFAAASSSSSTSSNDDSTRQRKVRRQLQEQDDNSSGVGANYNSSASDYFPEVDVQWSSSNFTTSALTTQVDVTPVVIYSIQFLEVDTSFNVINQDSAYVRGIDFVSGDTFNYTSISATSRGVVPGGMNMVLRGVNANGDPVRNVFTITYTNDCGVPTFTEGDAIGWVVFENFEPASEDTCGSIATLAPSTGGTSGKGTSPPSKSPSTTTSSSKIPTSDDYIIPPWSSMSYPYMYGGKSAKVTKSSKSKGGKSNYKSTEGSDGHNGWHSDWNGNHGGSSTRPEPYRRRHRSLLPDDLLKEIKLDQYDHSSSQHHHLAELRGNTKRKQRR